MNGKTKRLAYRDFQEHDHVDADAGWDEVGLAVRRGFKERICAFCGTGYQEFKRIQPPEKIAALKAGEMLMEETVLVCRTCGWWQLGAEGIVKMGPIPIEQARHIIAMFERDGLDPDVNPPIRSTYWAQYHGVFKVLDLASADTAMDELKAQLWRRWDDRKYISADAAERLVADLLRDHLDCEVMQVKGNANTADAGIDLYVCSKDGEVLRAVQVKRRETDKRESLKDIRNFVGALLMEGHDDGIFVTTASSFTGPAMEVPKKLADRHERIHLSLIDGERLLELLENSGQSSELRLPELISGRDGLDRC